MASGPALLLRRGPAERELLIPLDPVSRDVVMECVRGSHRWGKGFRPMRFNGTRLYARTISRRCPTWRRCGRTLDLAVWDMQPGDAIAFNFRTLHAAPGNAAPRRAASSRRAGLATMPSLPGARARPRRRSGTSHSRTALRSTRRSSPSSITPDLLPLGARHSSGASSLDVTRHWSGAQLKTGKVQALLLGAVDGAVS